MEKKEKGKVTEKIKKDESKYRGKNKMSHNTE